MLHETAVAWLRYRLKMSLAPRWWVETPADFSARLRRCCAEINAELKVDDLCEDFPSRIQTLIQKEGGRLKE